MAINLDCYGVTDIGRVREVNQDQFLIADLKKSMSLHQTSLSVDQKTRLFGGSQGKLLVVADGMGGHAAGERASTLVVDNLVSYLLNTMQWFYRLEEDSEEEFQEDLKAALEHCQQQLTAEAEAIPQRTGMGTTLTMAYIIWPKLYVVHVGDSRCYLLRDSKLKQITRDHTMRELFKENLDAPVADNGEHDDATRWSHMLWNVIGGDSGELTPEVYRASLSLGDSLLLCTDGLTKHISDDEIRDQLDSDHSAEAICRHLVTEANRRGGQDNVTVVVARFTRHDRDLEVAEAAIDLGREEPFDPTADTAPLDQPKEPAKETV